MTSRKTLSFAVELVSGPAGTGSVDEYEIFYARRALRRLKTLISTAEWRSPALTTAGGPVSTNERLSFALGPVRGARSGRLGI
jgi:hypothetical protein